MKIFKYAAFFALIAGPLNADPITAAIVSAIGVGTSTFAAAVVGFFVNTLASVVLSALSMALQGRPTPPGIKTKYTKEGGVNSASFIMGYYATAGTMVCPPMTHDVPASKTPRVMATYVISLGDIAGMTLERVIVDGTFMEFGPVTAPYLIYDEYGQTEQNFYKDYMWLKYHDGSQTTADPLLMSKYGSADVRPWTSDMVGKGVCYAIMNFWTSREHYKGPPVVRFEVMGIPLYDPRKDSTVGGSGSHRWGNLSTYEQTTNPMVMIYNILRGVKLSTGKFWGGSCKAADLPWANWIAQMNKCDFLVNLSGGGTEKRYQAGCEVNVAEDEPAAIIEELLKACSGSISEMGGVYRARAGTPDLPVFFFEDGDLLVNNVQEYSPYPGLASAHNAISASHPSPKGLWEDREAPPIFNEDMRTQDMGQLLMATVALPFVPYPKSVQRLMRAWLKDDRRWRRHTVSFGPYASAVETLDTISWTSERNGYVNKFFEVSAASVSSSNLTNTVSMREINPSDYDWSEDFEVPTNTPSSGWKPVAPQEVPSWGVFAEVIYDDAGNTRRPAIRIVWDSSLSNRNEQVLRYQVRINVTHEKVTSGSTRDIDNGSLVISEGILPNTEYQVRGKISSKNRNVWTAWTYVKTLNIKYKNQDLDTTVLEYMADTATLAGIKPVGTLPAAGDKIDQIIMKVPEGVLYRWDGTSWTRTLFGGIKPGDVDIASFAASIRPTELFAALPTTGNFNGRIVYRTSDKSLWRHNGSSWINTNAADQIVGELVAGQIAAGAINTRELAANAVTITNLAIADFENLCPDPQFLRLQDFTGDVARAISYTSTSATYKTDRVMALEAGATNTTLGYRLFAPANIGILQGSFYAECYILFDGTVGNTAANIRIYVYNTAADGTRTYIRSVVSNLKTTAGISLVSCQVDLTDPAENTLIYCYQVCSTNGAPTTAVARFNAPAMRRMNGGELVVDGALKARHMATELIISNVAQLGVAVVSTASIANAAITTAKIGDLQVGTLQIKGNAVTTTVRAVNNTAIARPKDTALDPSLPIETINLTILRTSGLVTKVNWSALVNPYTETFDSAWVYVRIIRTNDNTTISSSVMQTAATYNTRVYLEALDTDTSGGTATYKVMVSCVYFPSAVGCSIDSQILEATQFKK